MHIIQLEALEEGVYNDHNNPNISEPPDGWAYIPEDMKLPSTFPRLGSLEVKDVLHTYEVEIEKINEETGEIELVAETKEKTMLTVISMTEGTLPEPVEEEPTKEEQLRADIDFIAAMTGIEL